MRRILQDARHGLRAMRADPAFTAVAVAALGAGANKTFFPGKRRAFAVRP